MEILFRGRCISLSEREKGLFCNVVFAFALGVEIPVTLESAEILKLNNAGLKGFYLLGMKDLLCYPSSKPLICQSGCVWVRKLQGHKFQESGKLFLLLFFFRSGLFFRCLKWMSNSIYYGYSSY